MDQEFKKAKELIDRSTNVLLTMHERMDGDDGGSVLAVFHHLKKNGKQVACAIKQGVPPALRFLPGSEKIADDIYPVKSGEAGQKFNGVSHQDFDLLIMFGCSSKDRCGSEQIIALNVPTINFDHHPDNSHFAEVNVVDPAKSSVAEMVYDFFRFHNWPITPEVATCLLTGIITDTGSFMHANTKNSTLKVAGELMRKGAQTNHIIKHTSLGKNPQILKAWGLALENSHYDKKHKIIYAVMTEKDLLNFKNLPQAAFEGFVETLNTYPDAKFAMFLRQDGNTIKGSLRSDPYKNTDVSQIAKAFGGGGHKLAAGFSLAGKLTKDASGKWRVI